MGWLGIWGWEGDAWRWDLGFTNLEESSVSGLEYVELMEMMSETCPIIGSPNIFLWPCGYLNSFSVKSYYDKLLQAADLVELESVLKTTLELIWNMKIPLKVKNFGWILLLDRLPTRSNLVVRGVISNIHDKVCVFCFNSVQDNNHVFISCPRIRLVWEKVVNLVGIPWMIEDNCCDYLMFWFVSLIGNSSNRKLYVLYSLLLVGVFGGRGIESFSTMK